MGPPQPKKKSSQSSSPQGAPPPGTPNDTHRSLKILGGILGGLVLLAIAGIAVLALLNRASAPDATDFAGDGEGTATVTIVSGATITDIGAELTNEGVVASTQAFVNAASADPSSTGLQPGTYELRQKMSAASALALLKDPASRIVNKFTIPEGTRLTRVLTIASEATGIPVSEFETALQDPTALGLVPWANGNAEGFLYPATYEYNDDSTAQSLLQQMITAFNSVSAEIDLEGRAAGQGLDPYDVVIKASLVEAEGVPEDFGKVARVIDNRLEQGMPLQFDSTSNYASDASNIQLSEAQLAEDTPFNTYLNNGLIPTPINQPGRASLEAVLAPEPGPWIYFVATDPDAKITKFTDDYNEHLRNVDEMFEKLRERGLQYQPD
jgi:UPF0755 protein